MSILQSQISIKHTNSTSFAFLHSIGQTHESISNEVLIFVVSCKLWLVISLTFISSFWSHCPLTSLLILGRAPKLKKRFYIQVFGLYYVTEPGYITLPTFYIITQTSNCCDYSACNAGCLMHETSDQNSFKSV